MSAVASAAVAAARAAACALALAAAAQATARGASEARPAQQAGADELLNQEALRVRDAERQHASLARRALLREAWLAADDETRAAAHGVLAALRDPDAPPGSPPTARAASDALSVLRGRAPAELGPLERFADALALELRPGAFEARAEGAGRGEFTTVRVHALWEALAPPDEFVVNLHWLGPNGEELRARGEPVMYTALAAPGFDMYVRPPASTPGAWSMVAEVGYEGRTVRGIAVAVDCVADLAARVAALAPAREPDREPAAALLARDVLDVVERGVPLLPGASVEAWLERIEHGAVSERPGDVVPRVLDDAHIAWELVCDVPEPRGALVLVDAFSEPARGWFDGPGKRGWLEAARELGARVLALGAPLDDAAVAGLRRVLGAEDGAARDVVLVARGAAVADVLVRRPALADWVDGLVLETELGARSAPPPLAQPTLVLDASAADDGEEVVERDGRAPLRWVRRRALPVVADLELPELVAAWWRELVAARGAGSAR